MVADKPLTLAARAPDDIVRLFNAAWAAGDVDRALALVADEAVYTLHLSDDLMPIGGETVGRANIEAALRQVRRDYDYLLYRPLGLHADGNTVRHQVEFMYRHRRSGEILSGRFRMVMRVEHGQIVRAEEYHDRAKVEAFLRLFGQ